MHLTVIIEHKILLKLSLKQLCKYPCAVLWLAPHTLPLSLPLSLLLLLKFLLPLSLFLLPVDARGFLIGRVLCLCQTKALRALLQGLLLDVDDLLP